MKTKPDAEGTPRTSLAEALLSQWDAEDQELFSWANLFRWFAWLENERRWNYSQIPSIYG